MRNMDIRVVVAAIIAFMMFTGLTCNEDGDDPTPTPTNVGEVLWTWETGSEEGITSCPAIGNDGTIYCVTGGGTVTWEPAKVYAISSDSVQLWESEELDHMAASSDVMIGPDGTIYVVGYYKLYAINPTDGTFNWTWEAPDPHHTQIGYLTIGNDNTIFCSNIASGAYQRALFAVKNGQTVWSYTHETIYYATNLMITSNNLLAVFWKDGDPALTNVQAFDPATGAMIWTCALPEGTAGHLISKPSEGQILASTHSPDMLYFINQVNGVIANTKVASMGLMSMSPNGNICTFVFNTGLIGYNYSGSKIWQVDNGLSGTHGVAINSNNELFVVGWGGADFNYKNFQCFDSEGNFEWGTAFSTGNSMSAPLIAPDGKTYIYGGYRPGTLICIQGEGPLASTNWPRPQHDNKNTRNASMW